MFLKVFHSFVKIPQVHGFQNVGTRHLNSVCEMISSVPLICTFRHLEFYIFSKLVKITKPQLQISTITRGTNNEYKWNRERGKIAIYLFLARYFKKLQEISDILRVAPFFTFRLPMIPCVSALLPYLFARFL